MGTSILWATPKLADMKRDRDYHLRKARANNNIYHWSMKTLTAEVPYNGHVLTSNESKPDPSKVCAVEDMPSPADKPALLRFLHWNGELHE